LSARQSQFSIVRLPRKMLAALVLGIYLLAGVLHGVCDLDVTNPSGKTVISLVDKGVGQSEKAPLADHHCHGCFSVSVPAPVVIALAVARTHDVAVAHVVLRSGISPGIDPPPPKTLI
jgi:hypothetical protein